MNPTTSRQLQGEMLLLLAAFIWGFAFVAQRDGMNHLDPLTFNGIRFLLGAATVWLLIRLLQKKEVRNRVWVRPLLLHGIMAGVVLFIASFFQQLGIKYTTAGNAGFITSLYVLFVPLIGLFRLMRFGWNTWVGALAAVAGLYLLSVSGDFSMRTGDLLVLVSAVFWAFHVLVLDYVAPLHDFKHLAFLQFLTAGLLSLLPGLALETPAPIQIQMAWLPLLYTGVFSAGIGFTLQIAGQRKARADHSALILSLEAVFALLGGYLLLHETMGWKQLAGAALMLSGVVIAQMMTGSGSEDRKV